MAAARCAGAPAPRKRTGVGPADGEQVVRPRLLQGQQVPAGAAGRAKQQAAVSRRLHVPKQHAARCPRRLRCAAQHTSHTTEAGLGAPKQDPHAAPKQRALGDAEAAAVAGACRGVKSGMQAGEGRKEGREG